MKYDNSLAQPFLSPIYSSEGATLNSFKVFLLIFIFKCLNNIIIVLFFDIIYWISIVLYPHIILCFPIPQQSNKIM